MTNSVLPHKFQSMILGNTDQEFSYVVNGIHIKKRDDIDQLGVNIASKLTFNKHVSAIYSEQAAPSYEAV